MSDAEPAGEHGAASGSRAIGWIGLGEMGLPMAGHLVRAGHVVVGHDASAARLAAAEAQGVHPAAGVSELVARSEVIFTMLRTGSQTEEVVLGQGGLLGAGAREMDVVVMSTMDPASMRTLASAAADAGLTVLDVPVSGGVRGAEAATLAIMASGSSAAVSRVRPLLDLLGARVYVLGDRAGMSQAAKLANQVMMAVAIAGTWEGLALARDHGLGDAEVIEAVAAGTGCSWPLQHWDWMRSLWEEYEPDNALDILEKDLRAVIAAVRESSVEMPVTQATFERLTEMWAAARRAAEAGTGERRQGP